MSKYIIFALSSILFIFGFLFFIPAIIKMDKVFTEKPQPPPQAQKFRYGEQCQDGSRVEYIREIRLPKSVVCQKAVGD
jgi:hypothetical protein